uniref:Uncharacterized protein n=1 Tax=Solanum tuberosum TaxID=4113 RepID=M1BGX3_SOLTU
MDSTGKKKNFKKVRVIDLFLDIGELELRRWETKMSVCYVLNGKWTKMCICNINEGNMIQIWDVRMDDDEFDYCSCKALSQ